jgi:hypothetical protein
VAETARYRAVSRLVYSQAFEKLLVYARESDEDFTFGPTDFDALDGHGLTVSGPDLNGVREVLAGQAGLTETPD